MRAVVIVDAVVGSRPGFCAALAPLGRRLVLGWCLDRLRAALPNAQIALSTTTRREDDAIEREATARRVRIYRAPTDDPLRRLRLAAASAGARFVIRATVDNALIDLDAPARVLRMIAATEADYVGENGLPAGSGVEAVSLVALQRSDARVTDARDRQMVTSYVRREHTLFKAIEVSAPPGVRRPDLRFAIETAADLRFLQTVTAKVDSAAGEPTLAALIEAADSLARKRA